MADFCLIPALDGQLCPVVLWDARVHTEGNSVLKLTWGEYQNTLEQRCLMPKSVGPKSDSIGSTVHHYEWSKLALFDFLLQVMKGGLYRCPRKEHFSSSPFCFRSVEVSFISVNGFIDRLKDKDGLHYTENIRLRWK